jgi:hypothetical protein
VDPFSRSGNMDVADDVGRLLCLTFSSNIPQDGFGPFSDASSVTLTASGSDFGDPFSFGSGSSLSDDDVVNSFDFGDFQNAEFAEAEADLDTFGDFGGNFEPITVVNDSIAGGSSGSIAGEGESGEHKTPKPPSAAGWSELGPSSASPVSTRNQGSDGEKQKVPLW